MARKRRHEIGALGYGKQRRGADPADLAVVPARQRLGAGQLVVPQVELRLEHHFDLVPLDRPQQIGFELDRCPPRPRGFPIGPGEALALLAAHVGHGLRQPVEQRFGAFTPDPA